MILGWPTRLAGLVPAGLVAACLAAPPSGEEPEPAAPATAALAALDDQKDQNGTATPIDWGQGDCLSQLRTLQRAAHEGSLGPAESPPFAVELVAPSGSWLDGVPDVPIEVDLPLAMVDAGAVDGARCVLRIGPARQQNAAHRAVDLQDVHSSYQSGLRSERNPDYDAAQLKHRQVRDQAKGSPKIMRVNDPLLDLIGSAVGGVITTFDQRSRRQALDKAAAELAATPRSHDKPVFRPYSFERVVVRAQKQALVPVALLDAQGRSLQEAELRQSERREFFVLRGLDPRDRDYEQHRATSMTRADLARWARTPPVLRLTSVAIALTEGTPVLPPPDAEPNDPWSDEAMTGDESVDPWLEEAFAEKEEFFGDDLDQESPAITAGVPIAARSSDTGQPGFDIDDLMPGLALAPSAEAAPAMTGQHPGVVAVRAGKAAGHGFYVRGDMVLTTHGLVAGISVVDVTTADGATVPALVAAVDQARDLALLQVPRPGPAVVLHEGPAGAPKLPGGDLGPGRPVFSDDRVVGMTSNADQQQGVIRVDAIREFLDGQAGVFAAVP